LIQELDSADGIKQKLLESEEIFREKCMHLRFSSSLPCLMFLAEKKVEESKQLDIFYQKEKERLAEKEASLENLQVRPSFTI
jgi:hypothetical protein